MTRLLPDCLMAASEVSDVESEEPSRVKSSLRRHSPPWHSSSAYIFPSATSSFLSHTTSR
jgi:hypothetical protein